MGRTAMQAQTEIKRGRRKKLRTPHKKDERQHIGLWQLVYDTSTLNVTNYELNLENLANFSQTKIHVAETQQLR